MPNQPQSTRTPRLLTHQRLAIMLAVLAVCTPLAAATIPSSLAASPAGSDEALDAKDRAQARLAELEALDDTAEVTIEQQALRSIRNRIQQGNLSYERANYEQAKEQYDIARDQARAALKQGYNRRAALLLNASVGHLQALDKKGYTAADTETLAERADRLRERLADAQTLGDARSVHDDVADLHGDVNQLPPESTVKLANRIDGNQFPIAVLVVLSHVIGAAVAVKVDHVRRPDRNNDEEDDDDAEDRFGIRFPMTAVPDTPLERNPLKIKDVAPLAQPEIEQALLELSHEVDYALVPMSLGTGYPLYKLSDVRFAFENTIDVVISSHKTAPNSLESNA